MRCSGITDAAFEMISDDWAGLRSLEDISFSFYALATSKLFLYLIHYHSCEKLNGQALQHIAKLLKNLGSLQSVKMLYPE